MSLGAQTERVVVQAETPQLQTESAVVGTVVDNRTIADLPLINRRAAQLARLFEKALPGVVSQPVWPVPASASRDGGGAGERQQ